MKAALRFILIIVIAFVYASCKDPYVPNIKELDKEILVVEGYIDGGDQTIINLSRVKSMGKEDTSFQQNITDAAVVVESEDGNNYSLLNHHNGNYSGYYNLSPNTRYRIRIQLKDGRNYESRFVDYKTSPPIDSLTYKYETDGVRFYVNTHDQSGNTKYFRWKYEETWEFHSVYQSEYMYDSDSEKVVKLNKQIYDCWQHNNSTDIIINNTANLNQNEMKDMPLLFIPNGSYKLSYLYSLYVKQYAMDSVGYNYFRQLKKNTEETGSIFDPQPGNLKGNIFNTVDSTEIVVGYIGAGRTFSTRQFFKIPWNYFEDCAEQISVPNIKDSLKAYLESGGYWPLEPEPNPFTVTSWTSARKLCVDCTLRGTNLKPSYWP